MKFCSFCGKQLEDSAVVCDGCNNAVAPAPAPAPAPTPAPVVTPAAPAPAKKNNNILMMIMNLGTDFSVIMSLFCAFTAIANAYIDVNVNIGTYSIYGYGYFEPTGTGAIFSLLFALSANGLAIASLIITLIKRPGLEKILTISMKVFATLMLLIGTFVLIGNAPI